MLAQHCENAELTSKAVEYYQSAADRALSRWAAAEAAIHATSGLKLIRNLAQDEATLRQELCLQLSLARSMIFTRGEFADETGAAFIRARELCDVLGNTDALFQVLDGLCVHSFSRRDIKLAFTYSEELLALAEQKQDRQIKVTALRAISSASFLVGKFRESRNLCEELLCLYRPEEDEDLAARTRIDPRVSTLAYLSLTLLIEGLFDQSNIRIKQSIDFANKRADPASLVFAMRLAAFRCGLLSAWSEMRQVAEELLVLTERFRLRVPASEARFFQYWAALQLGDSAKPIAEMRQSLDLASSGRQIWPYFLAAVGSAEAFLGNFGNADQSFKEALVIAEQQGEYWYLPEIMRQQAEVLRNEPKSPKQFIERALVDALRIAGEQGAHLWQLRAAVSLGRMWAAEGRQLEANRLIIPLYSSFAEGLSAPDMIAARELVSSLG